MSVKDCLNWWWMLWGEGYTWWAAASLRQRDLECLRKPGERDSESEPASKQLPGLRVYPLVGGNAAWDRFLPWVLPWLPSRMEYDLFEYFITATEGKLVILISWKPNNQSKEADCSWELASGLPSCCVLAMRISRQLWVHRYLISTFQFHFLQLPFEFC